MARPRIGITVDYDDELTHYESPYAYASAVEKAGGLPFLLPHRVDLSLVPQYVDLCDGMLFSGGNDLNPVAWGETYHPKTAPVDPFREKFERALMIEVEKRRMPTLGICMGSQLMNVHRGGSLYQFLPDVDRANPIEHRKAGGELNRAEAGINRHAIKLENASGVAPFLKQTEISANTSHKQSVNKVGRGLRIIATSPDGVIEGIEDPSMPLFLGVQWHPERLHDEPEHLAFFKLLVEKSKEKK